MAKGLSQMKKLGLCLGLVIAAAAAGIFVYVLNLRVLGGQTLQRLESPDGTSVAEVNSTGAAGATDGAYIGVMLHTRYNPFRQYVFAGLDYGVKISISWTDSKDLLIKCKDCTNLRGGNIRLDHWDRVAIHYDFE